MRVAHISRSLSRSAGGLYCSVSGLVQALAAQGVEVTVFGGADGCFEDDRPIWDGVALRPHRLTGGYGWHWRVFRRLLACRPDLVHVHGIWSATSIYGRFAQLARLPTVVSPHGMLDPWIVRRRAVTKSVHAALFERPLLACGHVHALSEAEHAAVSRFLPSADTRTFILANGTSPVAVREAAAARSGVLYLGRLHPKKQVLELATAWARSPLLRQAQLCIAGWGDPGYEAAIRSVAEASANVRFVGALYGDAKVHAFERARAFILPSVSEGMPMAVLEALQHGCLPLITDQCNLPELLAAGMAWRIESDLSDFERVVLAAVAGSDETMRRRSDALSAHAERYRWSEIAGQMIAHYRSIIGEHSAARRRG